MRNQHSNPYGYYPKVNEVFDFEEICLIIDFLTHKGGTTILKTNKIDFKPITHVNIPNIQFSSL